VSVERVQRDIARLKMALQVIAQLEQDDASIDPSPLKVDINDSEFGIKSTIRYLKRIANVMSRLGIDDIVGWAEERCSAEQGKFKKGA